MRRSLALFLFFAAALVAVVGVSTTAAQSVAGGGGPSAGDFPPGYFTDGNSYHLADFKGKVLALYFFEPGCPRCRASIPERNALVKSMAGKPVKFIAVGANISPLEALTYQRENKLEMPVFADTYGLMQARYKMQISLQNVWQYRILNSEGKVAGGDLRKEAIEKVADQSSAAGKYVTAEVDPKFVPLAELFEFGQFPIGVKQLAAARKTAKKGDMPSLTAIQTAFKSEAAEWSAEAASATESDPIRAYDLYSRVAANFPTDELGKAAQKSLKSLAADKTVKAELAARPAYNKIAFAMSQVTVPPRENLAAAFADVAKKHPTTPTGLKAKTLAEELGAKGK